MNIGKVEIVLMVINVWWYYNGYFLSCMYFITNSYCYCNFLLFKI